MSTVAQVPLIRWAGSKRQLLPKLIQKLPARFGTYIEPFAGSACLFFAVNPPKAILSDRNSDLIETYKTIIRHPIRVLRLAQSLLAQALDWQFRESVRAKMRILIRQLLRKYKYPP